LLALAITVDAFGKFEEWKERGIGLKFSDGLHPRRKCWNLSLKAWYGATKTDSSTR